MKNIVYISLFILAFSACKRPEEPVETYYIDKELYDYALFPKGSWWVYMEETSGLEDSVVVIRGEKYLNTFLFSTDYYYEIHDIDIYSSMEGEGWGGAIATYRGSHGYCIFYERFTASPSVASEEKFYSNLKVGEEAPLQEKWSYLKKSDTLGFYTLESATFSDVIVFEKIKYIDYDMVDYDVMKRYFFAKNIGLIREEDLVDSQIWNITSYSIK